jgi:hypothetical protein
MKTTILAAALAAVALLPGIASASFILDTGTPTGSGAALLNTNAFVAGEFSVQKGETITQLAAYLTQGVGQPGDTFIFDIYAAGSGFTARSSQREIPALSAVGTFTANGWNSTSVNWTAPDTASYWLALQLDPTSSSSGLDLPFETVGSTGSVPALGFAFAGASHQYSVANSLQPGVGLEVSVAPVPLPAAVWLLLSGLSAALPMARRRRH